jgi:pimeloyl-ACP methyl ester carboxylesterase
MCWGKRLMILIAAVLALGLSLPARTSAQPPGPPVEEALGAAPMACDPDGQQASGAIYRICMPTGGWNGDLVLYAHGYVRPTEPVGIPEDQMSVGGISLADLVTLQGYAFATTSYSTNGLAVPQALADLADLLDIFAATKGIPDKVYLTGVSEGGLITVLGTEGRPDLYDGGLGLCGPYGDFGAQINYLGDVRVLFDYFFPGLIPGDAVQIPEWMVSGWDAYYDTTVKPQLLNPVNERKVDQLLRVLGVPYDPQDPTSKEQVLYDLLSYNVEGTNDAFQKLGGQPYDNHDRVYSGSDDDVRLNREAKRFRADAAALGRVESAYQTSGELDVPLVTLHTTGDHVVPLWHSMQYRGKTISADNIALHDSRQVEAYGHCEFTVADILGAFERLVDMVEDPPPYRPVTRLFLPILIGVE